MNVQTKSIIAGVSSVIGAKYFLQQSWRTAAIAGGIVLAGFLILTALPGED